MNVCVSLSVHIFRVEEFEVEWNVLIAFSFNRVPLRSLACSFLLPDFSLSLSLCHFKTKQAKREINGLNYLIKNASKTEKHIWKMKLLCTATSLRLIFTASC